MGKRDKRPAIAAQPSSEKKPKFASDPSVKGSPITWRFSHADRGGPFAWTSLEDASEHKDIIERLASFETMTENDLSDAGCHAIELHQLCKEAQDRLRELQYDDLDSLYSLRVTGKVRIFCVHHSQVMRVLWYDPKHEVCPSNKKHT